MCKEDVRMSRQAAPLRTREGSLSDLGSAAVFGGNPNRSAISVCVQLGDPAETTVVVVSAQAGGLQALAILNINRPSVLLRVEDYGVMLLGEIFLTAVTENDQPYCITEIAWNLPLEQL